MEKRRSFVAAGCLVSSHREEPLTDKQGDKRRKETEIGHLETNRVQTTPFLYAGPPDFIYFAVFIGLRSSGK